MADLGVVEEEINSESSAGRSDSSSVHRRSPLAGLLVRSSSSTTHAAPTVAQVIQKKTKGKKKKRIGEGPKKYRVRSKSRPSKALVFLCLFWGAYLIFFVVRAH